MRGYYLPELILPPLQIRDHPLFVVEDPLFSGGSLWAVALPLVMQPENRGSSTSNKGWSLICTGRASYLCFACWEFLLFWQIPSGNYMKVHKGRSFLASRGFLPFGSCSHFPDHWPSFGSLPSFNKLLVTKVAAGNVEQILFGMWQIFFVQPARWER